MSPGPGIQLDVPSHSNEVKVSFPADHVLLLSMNRPKVLNAMSPQMEEDINTVLNWFDGQVSLWCVADLQPYLLCYDMCSTANYKCCAKGLHRDWGRPSVLRWRWSQRVNTDHVLTLHPSLNQKSFHLPLRWDRRQQNNIGTDQERILSSVHGFGSISRRQKSSKPIIAAVNGGAYGGGLEMVLNCDIVIASDKAQFAFPEVKRGVVAAQGGARYAFDSRIFMVTPCAVQLYPDLQKQQVIRYSQSSSKGYLTTIMMSY